MFIKTMFVLVYFLSPVFLALLIFSTDTEKYNSFRGALPMVLGCIAYAWRRPAGTRMTGVIISAVRPAC